MFTKIYNYIIKILVCLIPVKKVRKSLREKLSVSRSNNKILVHRKNGKIISVKKYKGLKIKFYGSNSIVEIWEPCIFDKSSIILGSKNYVEIKSTKYCISNLNIPIIMSPRSKLVIDEDFSCCGVDIYLHDEPDLTVKIGKDCQCSFGVIIWPSDGHTITDNMSGKILNFPKMITINDHVWIGMHTRILKGSIVPSNSVIGANSVYTSSSNKLGIKLGGGGGIRRHAG